MSAPFRPTIGLEIHAELKTSTKMFCNSKNDPDEVEPNKNTCPVCLAHPGTLPSINREAVRHVLRVGTALGSNLADYTEFDRKSYFYPDIPKGYQISQYEFPLVSGGSLKDVAITRIHLEEDTARSTHSGGASLVDFNRAGVPLMELVTEPVIHDAKTAGDFARELQLLLRTLGVSDANLEKGEMRVEANISVSNTDALGTKVEVKNLNSFRSVERAIAYEIDRHITALQKGEALVQETRGWDEGKQQTFHQRFKEGSADYRYFPEPDLPKLVLSEVADLQTETLTQALPELPWDRRERYQTSFNMKEADIETIVANIEGSIFIDTVAPLLDNDQSAVGLAVNYFLSDLKGDASNVDHASFAKLIRMIKENTVSSRGAKDVLARMKESGGDPEEIAKSEGLMQESNEEVLVESVRKVLADHAGVVEEYKGGKQAALQFLVGQGMKATKGAGNPALIREIIVREVGV